jgi:hypothetical protein
VWRKASIRKLSDNEAFDFAPLIEALHYSETHSSLAPEGERHTAFTPSSEKMKDCQLE